MLEAPIEAAFVTYAKKRGCIAYKFTSPNRRSVPDRVVLIPGGRVFFVEFKATGKLPTDAQHREINRLKALGFSVYVIDEKGVAETMLDMYLAAEEK